MLYVCEKPLTFSRNANCYGQIGLLQAHYEGIMRLLALDRLNHLLVSFKNYFKEFFRFQIDIHLDIYQLLLV